MRAIEIKTVPDSKGRFFLPFKAMEYLTFKPGIKLGIVFPGTKQAWDHTQ
ncbi:MAG: hypothetical protein Ct9H300mP4_02660 [Gammaproteobacteria bacterium]|nr:MAG: hypothetical protein Ct9H300mP4_02660 [Gammaproteobacteria bacterium]